MVCNQQNSWLPEEIRETIPQDGKNQNKLSVADKDDPKHSA